VKSATHPVVFFAVRGHVVTVLGHVDVLQAVFVEQVLLVEYVPVLQVEHVLLTGQVAPELELDP
jgi:hypothetical protein